MRTQYFTVAGAVVLTVIVVRLDMRANDDIGEDAFHVLEEQFDWIEMGSGARDEADTSLTIFRQET